VIYGLKSVFKTGVKTVEKYASSAFDVAKKFIFQKPLKIANATMVCKLLKALLNYGGEFSRRNIDLVQQFFKVNSDTYEITKNDFSSLVARSVLHPLFAEYSDKTEGGEWDIGNFKLEAKKKSVFASTLEEIRKFPRIIDATVMHFLDLITPEIIHNDYEELFGFIRMNSETNMERFIRVLPEEGRSAYFRSIAKDSTSTSQLRLLTLLSTDNGSIMEAAVKAMQLASSRKKEKRSEALFFYRELARKQPMAAKKCFKQTIKNLVENQDSKPLYIRCFAYIAKTILVNMEAPDVCISENKELIDEFITTALSSADVESPLFAALFHILSALPEEFSMREDINIIVSAALLQLKDHHGNQQHLRSLKAVLLFSPSKTCKQAISLVLKLFEKLPFSVILAVAKASEVIGEDLFIGYLSQL